jgi:hypothetical protein
VSICGHGLCIRQASVLGSDNNVAPVSFVTPLSCLGGGIVSECGATTSLGKIGESEARGCRWPGAHQIQELTGTLQRFNPHLMIIRTNVI